MTVNSVTDPIKTLETEQRELNWVGMANLRLPIRFRNGEQIEHGISSTKIFVDLNDRHARGIHMSRSYDLLHKQLTEHVLSPQVLRTFLGELLTVHTEYSTQAKVEFSCELLLLRKSLVSNNEGWNYYPLRLIGKNIQGTITIDWEVTVFYSGTCPASASLAQQTIQEQFDQQFGTSNTLSATQVRMFLAARDKIVATPHGQRSSATIRLRQEVAADSFPLTAIIDRVENALGTPVQTAVKREDEREFARLNGQNLMFCEDAARRLSSSLDDEPSILDYLIQVEHYESLHAHDAVCVIDKGIQGGFKAEP
ncbi:MAG: GTP cyclohydrolase FolE2 [Gammaproteobacteria bacterium]|nr:GTP cyclohydrolase FolE2 [Gammaproteobacteria bacterium]